VKKIINQNYLKENGSKNHMGVEASKSLKIPSSYAHSALLWLF
jgi:hypothetical protein